MYRIVYQTMSEMLADLERLSAGRAAAFDTQQLFGSTTDAGLADLLKDFSISPRSFQEIGILVRQEQEVAADRQQHSACWFLWRASSSVSRRKTARWSSK